MNKGENRGGEVCNMCRLGRVWREKNEGRGEKGGGGVENEGNEEVGQDNRSLTVGQNQDYITLKVTRR
jgi:hypothetical protein